MGFDLYYVVVHHSEQVHGRKLGFDVRFGHPLAEFVYGYVTYKNEGLQIGDADPGIDQIVISRRHRASCPASCGAWFATNATTASRRRTATIRASSLETAGLGGDKNFVKLDVNNRFYTKIVGDLVFRTSTEIGKIFPIDDQPFRRPKNSISAVRTT